MVTLVFSNATQKVGYWGPVSASVDWCEPNYIHSYYIAETWNTWSNLFYIFFALYGIITTLRFVEKLVFVHLAAYFFTLIIGIGSFLFHATLQRSAQLLDEFPMLWAILCVFYAVSTHDAKKTTTKKRVLTFLSLFAINVANIIAMILQPDSPVFFFASFGILAVLSVVIEFRLSMKKRAHNSFLMSISHTVLILLGFFVWNLDNQFCNSIEHLKLHSIWHVCTSISTYQRITNCAYMYYYDNGYEVEYRISGWRYFLPFLSAKQPSKKTKKEKQE